MKKAKVYALEKNKISFSEVTLQNYTIEEHPLICVYDIENADIFGFGFAMCEATAYNYAIMPPEKKKQILELLFGKTGLRYRLFRLCIGSSDFTLDSYCYKPTKESRFDISRDKKYIIPFIKDVQKFTNNECVFMASPWSPPAYMKTNNERLHGGRLKKEYYDEYIEYLIQFLKEYEKEGIKISYMSIQNEQKAIQTWESCEFNLEEEREFAGLLKKALKKNNFNIKLLAWDHNKERLITRGLKALDSDVFDGIAYHWYTGDHFDAVGMVRSFKRDTILIESEFCRSVIEDNINSNYALEFVNSIGRGTNGLIEWNAILDEKGGPYHNRQAGCDATLRINSKTKSLKLSNYYNEVFMFTNFIDVGAKSLYASSYNDFIKVCAVRNKNGEIVVNLVNKHADSRVKVCLGDKFAEIDIKADGVYTIIFK